MLIFRAKIALNAVMYMILFIFSLIMESWLLSFFIIFYEQRFYEQKSTGVTCKAHCCCVHTKLM